MTAHTRRLFRFAGLGLSLLLAAGIIAPYLSANQFAGVIRRGLERALGRKVEIGAAHFDLFTGPGFRIENVLIHEDPSVGPEPFAYVSTLEAVPRLLPLLRGRLEFASVRLDDATINLVKSGPASEQGHWNFEPFLNRSLIATFPEIHVRNSRIDFKFGLIKSIFYLTDTDLDVAPPSRWSMRWRLQFSGAPARTDRRAGGFGRFAAEGYWNQGREGQPDRLDLDLELAKGNVSEIIALIHGQHAGIHGAISSRMHLAGPWDQIQIAGQVSIEDVHRWDLLPPKGLSWPFNLQGRLDLTRQRLEMVSSSSQMAVLPLSVRFRLSDYLFQPHWGVSVNWNQFPTGAVLELARHMGVPVPARLKMTGIVDGAIGYEGRGRVQGALSFHNTVLAMPDSPAVHFDEAAVVFADGHARLSPAVARVPLPSDAGPCAGPECAGDQVQLEADFAFASQAFSLAISTGSMHVEALRSQAALARVPWLEQVGSGTWNGQLRYQFAPDPNCRQGALGCVEQGDAQMRAGWSGRVQLTGAEFPLPGLAAPLKVHTANAQIQGARVVLERIQAEIEGVALRGEYRYEPQTLHPHRLRLMIPEADASSLEKILQPTLVRSRGLLARALGRALGLGRPPLPDWMADRHMEGAIQIDSLAIAGAEVEDLRARLLWDAARVELTNLQASVNGGVLNGRLALNLRGAQPAYELAIRLKGMEWKSGTVDADLTMDTRGLGPELLANLQAKGNFDARGLDLPDLPPFRAVAGSFALGWANAAVRLAFPELQLATAAGVYTGSGLTQADGRLIILLSNGNKELRMSGTLAQLRLEEPVSQ
jgi:hypothetical protein